MPRYWLEQNDGVRYGDKSLPALPDQARGLVPRQFICVNVCSFTFRFVDREELRDCLSFFDKKTHPSGILPMKPTADSIDHWHSQRWHERLPMYLQQNAKREKVLKALRQALLLLDTGKL